MVNPERFRKPDLHGDENLRRFEVSGYRFQPSRRPEKFTRLWRVAGLIEKWTFAVVPVSYKPCRWPETLSLLTPET